MASRLPQGDAGGVAYWSAPSGDGEKMNSETFLTRDARGRFKRREPADVAAIRSDYEETDKTCKEIAREHRISQDKLQEMVADGEWTRRGTKHVDPNDLVLRMFKLLGNQLKILETKVNGSGAAEAAVLGRLATTLDRLIAIKRTEAKQKPKQSREIDALRHKIAERIAELNVA
jgi:hypothetical protein